MHNLSVLQLASTRVRRHILEMTTEAQSGHPTSSLSAVELMVSLLFSGIFHYDVKNPRHPNNDRLLFSKGHATPLYYALWEIAGELTTQQLKGYRTFDSELEGHPSMRFPHTIAPTGSLGQGLSVGAGIALNGKYLDKLPYKTFVLLGDSEMAEGSNWEAIQFAEHYKLNNLIGILDVNRLGQRGKTMLGHSLIEYEKRLLAFGWNTILIEDGHDVEKIIDTYQEATIADRPTMIIAKTIKGKGVEKWEDQNNFHSKQLSREELQQVLTEFPIEPNFQPLVIPHPENVHPVDLKTISANGTLDLSQKHPTKFGAAHGVLKMLAKKPNLVVLDAEVSNSTHMEIIQEHAPEHFFEMFIAEQNMVGVGTGLATCHKIPMISTFSAFLSRAYDQLRMAQYAESNLKIFGSYAGVSLGKDGFSQMGLEDIAFFRTLHNSVILQPADAVSAQTLAQNAIQHSSLTYVRTTREPVDPIYSENEPFPIGGSKILKSSATDQLTVVASGVTVREALRAYDQLQQSGLTIRVIDLYSIKPLDSATLHQAAQDTKALLVVEDHAAEGGIAEAVRSELWDVSITIGSLAVRKLPRSGTSAELLKYEEIDAEAIVQTVKEMVGYHS